MTRNPSPQTMIRPARPEDAGAYLKLVEAFARFEALPVPDAAAKTRLIDHLFREHPIYRLLVALVDRQVVGYAAHFLAYSTFLAHPCFYLEDIFVLPEYRHFGIGHQLFVYCAKTAVAEGCERMEFRVLDWNQSALGFYQAHQAECKREWLLHQVGREKLHELASLPLH